MSDPIPFPTRRIPAVDTEPAPDVTPDFRGSSALRDVVRERLRIANLGRLPDVGQKLDAREELVRAAAMLVLRIEAMDEARK